MGAGSGQLRAAGLAAGETWRSLAWSTERKRPQDWDRASRDPQHCHHLPGVGTVEWPRCWVCFWADQRCSYPKHAAHCRPGGTWRGHPAKSGPFALTGPQEGELLFCNNALGSEHLCECSITHKVTKALQGWSGWGRAKTHLPGGSTAPHELLEHVHCSHNITAAQAAEMAGQQLDLFVQWAPVMVPVHLVTGLSSLQVGTGFLPRSPSPCCARPTRSLRRPSVTALEKNSNAGVIKDNELLISPGEHNSKHLISIAFLVELIKIKHKASQLYYMPAWFKALDWTGLQLILPPAISITKETNSTLQMIPSGVAAVWTITDCCRSFFHEHKPSQRNNAKEKCPLTTCSTAFIQSFIQCFNNCHLLNDTSFRRSVKTLTVALRRVFLTPESWGSCFSLRPAPESVRPWKKKEMFGIFSWPVSSPAGVYKPHISPVDIYDCPLLEEDGVASALFRTAERAAYRNYTFCYLRVTSCLSYVHNTHI